MPLYTNPLPVSEQKYKDLLFLEKFCNPDGQQMIRSLTHINMEENDFPEMVYDDPDSPDMAIDEFAEI